MFDHLDIYTPSERWAVGLADTGLSVLRWPFRRRPDVVAPQRILLLRLERIGDLLMSLGAIRAVRSLAPEASIDLVVGSWNASIARLITDVTSVEILDAAWLARGAAAEPTAALVAPGDAVAHAPLRPGDQLRGRHPLARVAGDRGRAAASRVCARRRRPASHRRRGVRRRSPYRRQRPHAGRACVRPDVRVAARGDDCFRRALWHLPVPDAARAAARATLAQLAGAAAAGSIVLAVHAPGGRAIKQWPVERFAGAAAILANDMRASVVLTGATADDAVVSEMASRLIATGVHTLRVPGVQDLVMLGAILQQCQMLLTGDTGPMHLAAAVGTPVLAVFGPSMPWRYRPLVAHHRIVRVDLPCSPCNRIRLPPERCQGHTPDCLAQVHVDAVVAAGRSLLASCGAGARVEAR